jgi:hypothetical protein
MHSEVFDELKKEIEALRANLKQATVVRDIVPEHVLRAHSTGLA